MWFRNKKTETPKEDVEGLIPYTDFDEDAKLFYAEEPKLSSTHSYLSYLCGGKDIKEKDWLKELEAMIPQEQAMETPPPAEVKPIPVSEPTTQSYTSWIASYFTPATKKPDEKKPVETTPAVNVTDTNAASLKPLGK